MGWLNLWAAAAAAFGQTTPAPQATMPPAAPRAPVPAATVTAPAPSSTWTPTPAGTVVYGQAGTVGSPSATVVAAPNGTVYTYGSTSGCGCASGNCGGCGNLCGCGDSRGRFESDHAFDGFIGPMSAPVFSKDPRSLTELRALYAHTWISDDVGGGDADLYGIQARVALSERLTFIADKNGYVSLRNDVTGHRHGWLNTALGLKYTFLRDTCKQQIAAVGVQYEMPTGADNLRQGIGDGTVTPFITYGREFGDNWHLIANAAYSFALDEDVNNSMLFTQIHLDKGINNWLYPLVELNWYHPTTNGAGPAGLSGDDVLNFGGSDVAGKGRLTLAAGVKAKVNCHVETGVAWEEAITGRQDILDHRVLAEVILRY